MPTLCAGMPSNRLVFAIFRACLLIISAFVQLLLRQKKCLVAWIFNEQIDAFCIIVHLSRVRRGVVEKEKIKCWQEGVILIYYQKWLKSEERQDDGWARGCKQKRANIASALPVFLFFFSSLNRSIKPWWKEFFFYFKAFLFPNFIWTIFFWSATFLSPFSSWSILFWELFPSFIIFVSQHRFTSRCFFMTQPRPRAEERKKERNTHAEKQEPDCAERL